MTPACGLTDALSVDGHFILTAPFWGPEEGNWLYRAVDLSAPILANSGDMILDVPNQRNNAEGAICQNALLPGVLRQIVPSHIRDTTRLLLVD